MIVLRWNSIVLLLAVAVVGCGPASENPDDAGNILLMGNGAEPEGLDPHIVTGVPEHHILLTLFEGLVNLDPEDLSPIPGVAESWTESPDGLVYTFRLRTDAKWSNGDAVTAHDFVYAWQRILTPALASEYAYMLHCMKNAKAFNEGAIDDFSEVGCKVIDDHTLEVRLENPTPYFLSLHIHYTWYPVHRATLERFGAMEDRNTKWTRPENFVGNGPFRLVSWEPNKAIKTAKSPTYWNAGEVALDGVHFFPITDIQTEERMFRSGDLHMTESVPHTKVTVYRENHPELIRLEPWLGSYFYRFNTTRPPFDDVRVRRAFAMSIDRQIIVDRILRGGQLATGSFTPPGMNGYTSETSIEYDVEGARRLLAEAGYPGGEGLDSAEILYNTSENHRTIAEAIQQMWKTELGVNVTLSNQDWKVYLDSTNNLDYEIARAGWIGDFVDPINFLECFTSDNGNNRTGYASAEYDVLIAQARRTKDQGERNALYQRAEKILLNDAPIIPIYIYTRVFLIAPEVKGRHANLLDYIAFGQMSLDTVKG